MANVNNEIEAFKSLQLMQEVARRLKLDINYVTRDGLRKKDLYSQSPIIVVFPESHDVGYFSFQVELLPDSAIVLSKFVLNENEPKLKIKTRLNIETETPIGNITISPSFYHLQDRSYNPITVSRGDIKSVALRLSKAVKVSLSNKLNTVLNLEIEDVSIQRAEDVLNNLIGAYQENWVNEKNKVTNTNLSFLDERITIAEQELAEIDGRVALYKSRNLVVSNAASLQMSQSMQYTGMIQEASNQISIAESIRAYLNDNTKLFELLPTNISGMNNPALETQVNNYNALLNERNRLAANSSGLNPVIIERNQSLQSMRQSIIQTVDNLIASLNVQLSGLQAQEARMTRNIASNPGQERYLMSVEREQKIKETLYQYLLQQQEENKMALIVTATNSQVISEPSGSNDPVKPKKIIVILMALMLGCGIPLGVILVFDFLNPNIRYKRDLAVLSVPLLGTIPKVKIENKKIPAVKSHGRGEINESFRILRTNFRFAYSNDTKVIQIISMDQGAGKTFVTLNLAMSFAVTGKKVALLDLDLRVASLSKLIINNPEKGIADILEKIGKDNSIKGNDIADMLNERKIDMNDIIKAEDPIIFDIIPAGAKVEHDKRLFNPVELLMDNKLAKIIKILKDSYKYDYIFIDSPPIHPVVDATLIAEAVDVSLFVVREGVTDRRKLSDIKNIFNDEKFKDMRLILNGSTSDKLNRYNAYYLSNNKNKTIIKFVNKLKDWLNQLVAKTKTKIAETKAKIAETKAKIAETKARKVELEAKHDNKSKQ